MKTITPRLAMLAVAVFALLFIISGRPNIGVAAACTTTVLVGGDIQTAINNATPGDTLCLEAGVHTPPANLTIGTSLTLRGDGAASADTRIEFGTGDKLFIAADDVTVENLHVINSASETVNVLHKGGVGTPNANELYENITLNNIIVEGGRYLVWVHARNFTMQNSEVRNNRDRDSVVLRQAQGMTTISGNSFIGGGSSRRVVSVEGSSNSVTSGTLHILNNVATSHSQFILLNMGRTGPIFGIVGGLETADLLIEGNTIDHQSRSGSSIIFFAPDNFQDQFPSILINENSITNPNQERLAVYVDYSFGGAGVPSNGQIVVSSLTFDIAEPWGRSTDTVHESCPVGFSSGAPAGMSLAGFDVEFCPVVDEALIVEIDIKPGSDPNSINPRSRGVIPVAILSTADFDAPAEVDVETLTFGRTGDEESLHRRGHHGEPNCGVEDVNGDGLLDLVCHFETQQTGFQSGDVEGILKGMTYDDVPFEGRDSVNIVP